MTVSHTYPLNTLLQLFLETHSNPLRSAQGSPSRTHTTPSLGLPLLLISLPLLWVSPKLLPHPTVPPENRSCYRSPSPPNPQDTILPGHSHLFLPKQLFLPSQHRPTSSAGLRLQKQDRPQNKQTKNNLSQSIPHTLLS